MPSRRGEYSSHRYKIQLCVLKFVEGQIFKIFILNLVKAFNTICYEVVRICSVWCIPPWRNIAKRGDGTCNQYTECNYYKYYPERQTITGICSALQGFRPGSGGAMFRTHCTKCALRLCAVFDDVRVTIPKSPQNKKAPLPRWCRCDSKDVNFVLRIYARLPLTSELDALCAAYANPLHKVRVAPLCWVR